MLGNDFGSNEAEEYAMANCLNVDIVFREFEGEGFERLRLRRCGSVGDGAGAGARSCCW